MEEVKEEQGGAVVGSGEAEATRQEGEVKELTGKVGIPRRSARAAGGGSPAALQLEAYRRSIEDDARALSKLENRVLESAAPEMAAALAVQRAALAGGGVQREEVDSLRRDVATLRGIVVSCQSHMKEQDAALQRSEVQLRKYKEEVDAALANSAAAAAPFDRA